MSMGCKGRAEGCYSHWAIQLCWTLLQRRVSMTSNDGI